MKYIIAISLVILIAVSLWFSSPIDANSDSVTLGSYSYAQMEIN